MYFDRFDVCEAWYLALSHCHSGQWSTEYERLCKLTEYFNPSPMLTVDSLTENGLEIYNDVVETLTPKNEDK